MNFNSISRIMMVFLILIFSLTVCFHKNHKKQMQVTATAYTSHYRQTQGNPSVTAWGDTLQPGIKAIAVSRDLIDSGLTHGTRIRIDDLPGTYEVLDKMHGRWTRRIDIYMGKDVDSAINWGIREVNIRWKEKTN